MRRPLPVLVLLTLLMAGCSGGGTDAEAVVAEATDRTTDARTARISQTVSVTPRAGDVIRLDGTGAIDFARRRATISMELEGETITVLLIGSTVYTRVPDLASETGGRSWLKVDLDAVGELAGVSGLGNLTQSQQNDPSAGLAYLRGARNVDEVGDDEVRGVDTTHYRGVVDVRAAAAEAPESQRQTVAQIADTFGITRVPVDVWIDGDGRARRLEQVIDYGRAKPTGSLDVEDLPRRAKVRIEFFDFGTRVAVSPPPAAEVADLTELLAEGSGEASPATDALEDRLISEVPAGYRQQPDGVGDTGPSDLEKAVRDDGADDARAALTRAGFVAGYQRLWANEDDGEIIDFLYQFRTAAGAGQYFQRTVADLESDETPGAFTVSGIPGARGLSLSGDDGEAAVVVFARGPYLAQVVMNGSGASEAAVSELARQQYANLA